MRFFMSRYVADSTITAANSTWNMSGLTPDASAAPSTAPGTPGRESLRASP